VKGSALPGGYRMVGVERVFGGGHAVGVDHDGGGREHLGEEAGRGAGACTFQLNLSALYGIGGVHRGCVAHVKGVLGDV
jgi:hypothetical protein